MISLTSGAAQELLAKIDRDPTAIRYWRQYLVLCFEQKAEEEARSIQVILNGLEQLWNEERHKAEAQAAKVATANPKASGTLAAAFLVLPLNTTQKECFRRLAKKPVHARALMELGDCYADGFKLYPSAAAHYDRALELATQDDLKNEILAAKAKLPSKPPPPAAVKKSSQSEMFGVKSPQQDKLSAAALMKRTGRLSVDYGNIQVLPDPDWPEKQKRLEEVMADLQNRLAELTKTPARHLRLPRSISASQWLDFLEEHTNLLLVTLKTTGINTTDLAIARQAPRYQLSARAEEILQWLLRIDHALRQPAPVPVAQPVPKAPLQAIVKKAEPPPTSTAPTTPLEKTARRVHDITQLIQADNLAGAENLLRQKTLEGVTKAQQSEVWASLGMAYQNKRETSRALAAYEYARALHPEYVPAWFNSGMILHEEGSLQPALDCYRRASELAPDQAKIWCNLGALQFQLQQFEEAAQSLRRAVELKPDYARAWDNLSAVYCAREELHEAERCCLRAINFKRDYADPHFKLGAIYFQQERWADAERVLRSTLDLQPGYPLAGHYLALLLSRQSRLEEALEVCDHATSPPGEVHLPVQVWSELGYNFYQKGDYLRALHSYLKALDYIPERATLWLDSGVAYHRLGQFPQALHHYEQATKLDPSLANAWANLALVKGALGDEAGAKLAQKEADRLQGK